MVKLVEIKVKPKMNVNYNYRKKTLPENDKEELKLDDNILHVNVSNIVESVKREVREEVTKKVRNEANKEMIQKVNELLNNLKNNVSNQNFSHREASKMRLKNVSLNQKEKRNQKNIEGGYQSDKNNKNVNTNQNKNITSIQKKDQPNLNQSVKRIVKTPKQLQTTDITAKKQKISNRHKNAENNNNTALSESPKGVANALESARPKEEFYGNLKLVE